MPVSRNQPSLLQMFPGCNVTPQHHSLQSHKLQHMICLSIKRFSESNEDKDAIKMSNLLTFMPIRFLPIITAIAHQPLHVFQCALFFFYIPVFQIQITHTQHNAPQWSQSHFKYMTNDLSHECFHVFSPSIRITWLSQTHRSQRRRLRRLPLPWLPEEQNISETQTAYTCLWRGLRCSRTIHSVEQRSREITDVYMTWHQHYTYSHTRFKVVSLHMPAYRKHSATLPESPAAKL